MKFTAMSARLSIRFVAVPTVFIFIAVGANVPAYATSDSTLDERSIPKITLNAGDIERARFLARHLPLTGMTFDEFVTKSLGSNYGLASIRKKTTSSHVGFLTVATMHAHRNGGSSPTAALAQMSAAMARDYDGLRQELWYLEEELPLQHSGLQAPEISKLPDIPEILEMLETRSGGVQNTDIDPVPQLFYIGIAFLCITVALGLEARRETIEEAVSTGKTEQAFNAANTNQSRATNSSCAAPSMYSAG